MTVEEFTMANGNRKVIEAVRDNIRSGHSIDIDTRDDLLFTAILDIYDGIEANQGKITKLDEKTAPAMTFYKVGVFFASAIGLGIVAFIGGLLTHTIVVTFP